MNRLIVSLLLCLMGLTVTATAQSPDELKVRFRDRLPALNALKVEGLVGENAAGYVEFVRAPRKGEEIVKAENADRRTLYASIAASTGTTTDLVSRRRALQIAAESPSGHMLKDEKGAWRQKP